MFLEEDSAAFWLLLAVGTFAFVGSSLHTEIFKKLCFI